MDSLLFDLLGQSSKDRGESEQALSQCQVVGGQVVDQEETQAVVMGTESFLLVFDRWGRVRQHTRTKRQIWNGEVCRGDFAYLDLLRDIDVVDQVLVVDDDNCVGVLWRRKKELVRQRCLWTRTFCSQVQVGWV